MWLAGHFFGVTSIKILIPVSREGVFHMTLANQRQVRCLLLSILIENLIIMA